MMDFALFLKSIVIGLAIAVPLGPIGVLCVNRTLEKGFWAGFSGGLGTALADGLYALLAGLGFAAFATALGTVEGPLKLFGGLFLIGLGIRDLTSPRQPKAASVGPRDLAGTLLATFLLTLANPATILSFVAIYAGLGLAGAAQAGGAPTVVAGVFAGSLLWWGFLSGSVALLRHKLPAWFARAGAVFSGAVLIGFGLLALVSLLPVASNGS